MRGLLIASVCLLGGCTLDIDALRRGDGSAPDADRLDAGAPPDAGPGVDAGADRIARIFAGGDNSCALSRAGRLFCWGDNSRGQLGTTDFGEPMPDPVEVGAADTMRFLEVAVGLAHICAITTEREIACWGDATSGQIGVLPDTEPHPQIAYPTLPMGQGEPIRIAAGSNHSCAIFSQEGDGVAGRIHCWGSNTSSQLGSVGAMESIVPRPTDLEDPATEIGLGDEYGCAVFPTAAGDSQRIRCWGSGQHNRLGRDDTAISATPLEIDSPHMSRSGIVPVALSVGRTHACAIDSFAMNQIFCWGDNRTAQIRGPSSAGYPTPAAYDIASQWTVVATGGDADRGFTCGVDRNGRLRCRGAREHGQLSDGEPSGAGCGVDPEEASALTNTDLGFAIDQLVAGNGHLCLLSGERLYCTGQNERGQLAQPTMTGCTPEVLEVLTLSL